jgi:TRAP-type C4-dicarboxylate transport system substrate-binding protein
MKRSILLIAIAVLAARAVQAEVIKVAIIAPEGSTWANVMKEMADELSKATSGRVKLDIYAGGVMGDEKVIVKKMEIGQVDAAGFTGRGLGEIYPAVRVLELPFLFKDSSEVDMVVEKFMPDIKNAFASKGYEFLGWAEVGFVYIFSNKPVKRLADMNGVKMWMWQGDPLAERMYKALGIVPVPLAIQDVLMALQTNMISGVYASPLGAVAMQWFTKTKYMIDLKLVNSIGGFVVTKRAISKLSPEDAKVFRELAQRYMRRLVEMTRKENADALNAIKGSGVEFIKIEEKDLREIVDRCKGVWSELAGTLYPKEWLDKVVSLLSR